MSRSTHQSCVVFRTQTPGWKANTPDVPWTFSPVHRAIARVKTLLHGCPISHELGCLQKWVFVAHVLSRNPRQSDDFLFAMGSPVNAVLMDAVLCCRGRAQKEGKMSYTEFVWFLMSEEDKRSPTRYVPPANHTHAFLTTVNKLDNFSETVPGNLRGRKLTVFST